VPATLTEVGGLDQATLTTSSLVAGTQTLAATYNGDATFASSGSNSVNVTINALPMIFSENVVRMRKINKNGKPVGKPVFVGFAFDYSTAMNPAAAENRANYPGHLFHDSARQ